MKKLLLILLPVTLFLVSCGGGDIQPASTYVPDTYFEQELINLGLDDVLDDYVLTGNINDLDELVIDMKGIQDLTGIEDFTALTRLSCFGNQLTSLDVSNNIGLESLYCMGNQITSLDLSNNFQLRVLFCQANQLTSLDVRNGRNIIFQSFLVYANPNLNCINVDDSIYSTSNWTDIDPQHYFSEDCP